MTPQPDKTTVSVALPLESLAILNDLYWCAEAIAGDAPAKKRTARSTTAEVRWTSVSDLRATLADFDADPALAGLVAGFGR